MTASANCDTGAVHSIGYGRINPVQASQMDAFFVGYIAAWTTACAAALGLTIRHRSRIELFGRAYWSALLQPWKTVTFVVAASGLTIMAPYTGDPTWDYVDALFMSVLAFTTAPWTVAIAFKTIIRQRPLVIAYIAACVYMFSISWSYDIYMVWRDGSYPITWRANIGASSVLYIAAGLMWNLTHVPGRGIIFGFMHADWPHMPTPSSRMLLVYALPLMILAAAMTLPFLWQTGSLDRP